MTTSHPLADGYPPAWAKGWGQDRYGVFVEITIGSVRQIFRWIPEGTFWMGSPRDEAGRRDWEWPRHQVTLTEGFWLADTPCTQELWAEVTDENPSEFVSILRPVENVRWQDVQEFLGRLSERSGLVFELPTEAQWERACRAGTDTATWLGDLEIRGERDAPRLDEIAWYGGNSGVDFDLEKGYDSSDWKEKQYSHSNAGTRVVALKKPNPWGLFDLLGNVWERCADYYADPVTEPEVTTRRDPPGPDEGSGRVIRGGSWRDRARGVRSAYRLWNPPAGRDSDLGFRLSLGREPVFRGADPEPDRAVSRAAR